MSFLNDSSLQDRLQRIIYILKEFNLFLTTDALESQEKEVLQIMIKSYLKREIGIGSLDTLYQYFGLEKFMIKTWVQEREKLIDAENSSSVYTCTCTLYDTSKPYVRILMLSIYLGYQKIIQLSEYKQTLEKQIEDNTTKFNPQSEIRNNRVAFRR